MLKLYLVAFCACKFILGAKLPAPANGTATTPVFQDECKDPKLNDCPSTSICVDQFYGFTCQCKPGLQDKSPDKENPGRICVAGTDSAPEATPVPDVAEVTTPKRASKNKSRVHNANKTTDAPKEEETKSPLIDPVARDSGTTDKAGDQKAKGQDKTKDNSDASKQALRDTFTAFDTNKDGQIDFTELKAATKNNKLNLSDADVRLMLKTADRDGNGKVSFSEFQSLMRGRRTST